MAAWLVTGCSSGLGRGIAEAALARGENVVVTARSVDRVADIEKAHPGHALAARLDLSDEESMSEALRAAKDRFGSVDVLVNNAGHGYRAAIEESEPDSVEELFRANFFGPMDLIRMALPDMRSRRSGVIVNVSSIGAVRGALGNGYYSAAKGALELATEALAKEVGHLGVRVLLIEPGAMRTEFFDDRMGASSHTISDYDALADRYRKDVSVGAHDQPGDPARGGRTIASLVLGDYGPMPQRLLLGSDAVADAQATLEARLAEAREWAPVSAQGDFEK